MRLSVFALDYDGTIASNDVLDPAMREAIAVARAQGYVVLLVTGRTLQDLRRVAGGLHFIDGIIAENGAVLHFPHSDHTSTLAPPIPERFLTELERRQISFRVGRCLVDADAHDGSQILDVIRALELPLVLIFNRGRVMAVTQGISKATGLNVALEMLRLSPRNTVAAGDAENDHDLLRVVEVGMAVEWGSAALQSTADVVVKGSNPGALADHVRQLVETGRLPTPSRDKRRLLLGHTDDGREISVADRGRNVLITGGPKSGKSRVAALLCEQMILHRGCVCVIDPRGDYRSLGRSPRVTVLGFEAPSATPRELLQAIRYPDRSVVIDLSYRRPDERRSYIRNLLPALNLVRERTGLPHRIVLGEAHDYLDDEHAVQLLDLEECGYTVVTSRVSRLPHELFETAEVIVFTGKADAAELEALRGHCGKLPGGYATDWSVLSSLNGGQAVALPLGEGAASEPQAFTLAPRLTAHVRHRQKYWDVPVSERAAFEFAANGRMPVRRARTLQQVVDALEGRAVEQVVEYLARGDISRWIRSAYGDHALANQLRLLEELNRRSVSATTVSEIVAAIRARYRLARDEEGAAEVPSA